MRAFAPFKLLYKEAGSPPLTDLFGIKTYHRLTTTTHCLLFLTTGVVATTHLFFPPQSGFSWRDMALIARGSR